MSGRDTYKSSAFSKFESKGGGKQASWKVGETYAKQPAKVWAQENLPPGYDPDVWALALAFRSEAEECGQDIHAMKIYGQILPRLKDSGLMDQDASSNEELDHFFQFIRWHYSTRKGKPLVDISDRELSGPKWRRFVEIMMVMFWAEPDHYCEYGEHQPLEYFSSKDGFIRLLDVALALLVTSKDYRKVESN